MPPEKKVYISTPTEPLADFRMMISRNPETLFLEGRKLAAVLQCSEFEAEEARRFIVEDGLEVFAA